jgi:hypothetical protein
MDLATLPQVLTKWISTNLSSIGDLSAIRIRPCRRVPVWWIPGNRNVDGLVLWRTIYLRHSHWPIDPLNRRSIELLFHEFIHVEQFRRAPFLFPLKYLFNHLRYGYWKNPAEAEARQRASGLTMSYFDYIRREIHNES